ncbi:MAG: serine/threonine protein kinase [Candidatus Oleimicrobiaceae bacterium]
MLRQGEIVGDRYRVIKEIGPGGMGVVYLVVDTRVGSICVLKVSSPSSFADPKALQRFIRNARNVARINHLNTVVATDFGEHGGYYYLAMKYVIGISLKTALSSGPLPRKVALEVLRQLVRALSALHAVGLVHRDLKPSNVLLEKGTNRVVLTDFGIAKSVGPGSPIGDLTRPGQVVGTPAYMAPEYIDPGAWPPLEGYEVDLYGLGLLAYEMLTGERAFPASTLQSLQYQIVSQYPSQNGLDGATYSVIRKALEKDLRKRRSNYRSVEQFFQELEAITPSARITTSGRETGRGASWPLPLAMGSAVLVALIGVILAVALGPSREGVLVVDSDRPREVELTIDKQRPVRVSLPHQRRLQAGHHRVVINSPALGPPNEYLFQLRGGDTFFVVPEFANAQPRCWIVSVNPNPAP